MRRGPERRGVGGTAAHRGLVALALVGLGLGLAACGGSPSAERASEILSFSKATHHVRLSLVAGATGADAGFNFNGYGDGAMTITVPLGWTVDVSCRNASPTFTHSCAIVEGGTPGVYGAPLAFPGASIPNARAGLADGDVASFHFVAARPGHFRVACLVTGHELDGMWDHFDVVADAPQPAVRTRS